MRSVIAVVLVGAGLLAGTAVAQPAYQCATDTSAELVPRNAMYFSALYEDDGTLLGSARKCRWYAIDLLAGDLLGIYVGSREFDAYLYVVGPDGKLILQSDDLEPAGGGAAYGLDSGAAFQSVQDGEHLIIVTTAGADEFGEYWLYFATREILPGRQITGRLGENSLALHDAGLASLYLYRGAAGERLEVLLASPDFDTVLAVFAPSGEGWENDDAGDDTTSSRLSIVASGGGAYLVVVRAFLAGEEGRYALRLMRR